MPKKTNLPFIIKCTKCDVEIEFKDKTQVKNYFDSKYIEVLASPFYDSATVEIECECGNIIEL